MVWISNADCAADTPGPQQAQQAPIKTRRSTTRSYIRGRDCPVSVFVSAAGRSGENVRTAGKFQGGFAREINGFTGFGRHGFRCIVTREARMRIIPAGLVLEGGNLSD
jgi:hypothetical protein